MYSIILIEQVIFILILKICQHFLGIYVFATKQLFDKDFVTKASHKYLPQK